MLQMIRQQGEERIYASTYRGISDSSPICLVLILDRRQSRTILQSHKSPRYTLVQKNLRIFPLNDAMSLLVVSCFLEIRKATMVLHQ